MCRLLFTAVVLLSLVPVAAAQPPRAGQPLPAGAILRLDHQTPRNEGKVAAAVYSPDERFIATAAEAQVIAEGRVSLWDGASGREIWRVKTSHHTVPCCIAFAPNGKMFAGCGNFGFLRFWDVASGKETVLDNPDLSHLWQLAFSPDGNYLATGSAFGNVSLWDCRTGKHLGALVSDRGGVSQISRVTFSPDGKIVLTAHLRETLFWDVATRRQLPAFRINGQGLMNPTFSPDGKYLTLRSEDHAVHLIDWETGKEVRTFAGVNSPVGEVGVFTWAFSPDGHSIALAQWNVHTVLLYEIATGRERARFVGHADRVGTLAFAPHGRALVSASLDHSALVWDVTGFWDGRWPAPKLSAAELARLWAELGSDRADKAYRAVWALALSPKQSVPFLAGKLFPKEADRLIADLEDDVAAVRNQAYAELKALGPLAVGALRRAKPRLAEAKNRIQLLLAAKSARDLPPSRRLQLMRALEVLELAGSPPARGVLEDLAGEEWSGGEARAALQRLTSQGDH
jgi:WD40 repeat protein